MVLLAITCPEAAQPSVTVYGTDNAHVMRHNTDISEYMMPEYVCGRLGLRLRCLLIEDHPT